MDTLDELVTYLSDAAKETKDKVATGVETAQKAIWEAMGVGKADAMSPQARLRYEEAAAPEKLIKKAPEEKIMGGDGSDYKAPTPDQIAKALIMREQIKQRNLKGEPK